MDDLKVVFYVVVAIIWMIYNNYKKVSEEAKKRDPSKPIQETITENWPKETDIPKPPVYQRPIENKSKQKEVRVPSISRRTETLKREPIRKERLSGNYKIKPIVTVSREGGNLQPSKLVHFEEVVYDNEPFNRIAAEIRNADFRQAFILSEVLQRPYI